MPDVEAVLAHLRQTRGAGGRGRRSDLSLWLQKHHDALAAEFTRGGVSWEAFAAALGKGGLLDGSGKPPTAVGCRSAWSRVRRRVAATSAARQASATPAASAPPKGVTMLGARSDAFGPVDDLEPRRTFRMATLKGMEPGSASASAPAAPVPVPRPVVQVQDPDEVIARMFRRPPPVPKG